MLGMRATASQDTLLDRAFIPDEDVVMVCPAGFSGAGPFQWHCSPGPSSGSPASTWPSPGGPTTRSWPGSRCGRRWGSRSMAHHPEIQHAVAEMRIALEGAEAHLDRVCDDWTMGVDHGGDWPVKIMACKHAVVSQAWSVVDRALDVSGGAGNLQTEPARATGARRSPRPHSPRQPHVHTRGRGQAQPGHQPRRTTPLGLMAPRNRDAARLNPGQARKKRTRASSWRRRGSGQASCGAESRRRTTDGRARRRMVTQRVRGRRAHRCSSEADDSTRSSSCSTRCGAAEPERVTGRNASARPR